MCLLRFGNIYKEQDIGGDHAVFPGFQNWRVKLETSTGFAYTQNRWGKFTEYQMFVFRAARGMCVSLRWFGCCNIPPRANQVKIIMAGQPTPPCHVPPFEILTEGNQWVFVSPNPGNWTWAVRCFILRCNQMKREREAKEKILVADKNLNRILAKCCQTIYAVVKVDGTTPTPKFGGDL